MYGKIEITGVIELVTGMHIGGSSEFAAIGAVDSPIVKDSVTKLPMIPGSSIKGKLRTLLAKRYNETLAGKPDDDNERITRLFGTAKKGSVKKSRVLFSDMIMSNEDEIRKKGIQSITEIKFENSINRLTAVANPRQIERAVRGSAFDFSLIYEIENDVDIEEIYEDFETIAEGLTLLQYDYIGGSGSRGYGKIKFNNLFVETVVGDVDDEIVNRCNEIIGKVEL